MAENEFTKEFMSFVQQKGFVWGPSPEIYGGMAGFYTYGPLGKLLKQNIEQAIRHIFYSNDFWEVECPTVMQKEVWEASGHLGGFTDPMVKCTKCKAAFRADTLIKEHFPNVDAVDFKKDQDLLDFIKQNNIVCSSCKSHFEDKIIKHNLMMKTTIGVDTEAYNRPETATTTYLPFLRYHDFFRKKFPFGVFQIGKAFRNEISPRQHLLRCREFTQAEGQMFIFSKQKNEFEKFEKVKNNKLPFWSYQSQEQKKEPVWMTIEDALKNKSIKSQAYAWTLNLAFELFIGIGIPKEKIRLRQHHLDEKAFYADDAWDVEIELKTFGWTECCGIHDRTDYDLKQHEAKSGTPLKVPEGEGGQQVYPHILEIAFGTDRPTFAILDLFYQPADKGEGKPIFKVPYKIAPVKAAVFPLMKKDGHPEYAQKVYNLISKKYVAKYDESGTVGRRYLREDEAGTPFCITIDYDSLKNNDVTIRDRDSGKQIRVKEDKLLFVLDDLLSGTKFETYSKI